MKTISKNSKIILIPEKLKDSSLRVKFSYIALKNLLYYVDKGTRTQTKHNRFSLAQTVNTMLDGYFTCAKEHNSFTEEECSLLKSCFIEKNQSLIFKNDYALAVEKELTFSKFAFYCNCLVELSFHIEEDYFNNQYITDTILELSNKMMSKINDAFIDFIVLDVNNILELIKNI